MISFFGSTGKGVFGLDIGYETLKLCEVKKSRNGVSVVGFSEVTITERILERDRIKDKAATANLIKEARLKAKPNQIRAKKIVSTLPETFVFSKTIQVPKMPLRELNLAVPNEAAQYLPIPVEDVYIDYQVLITHPDEALIDVLIAAAPKRLVDDYVEMAKMAGLELYALETKSIADGRALINEKKQKDAAVIVHIGTEVSRISIWDKGKIRLSTTVGIGKNQLTATSGDIANDKLELESGKNLTLEAETDKIIEEIIESIRYHQNRGYKPSKITEIIICGSGALISGIEKYITKKTQITSSIAKPAQDVKTKVDPVFSTAYGLALRD